MSGWEVHPDWEGFVSAFHRVGVLGELRVATLRVRLGHRAAAPPDDEGRSALLDDYYRGDGFADRARARTRSDGYVACREGEPKTVSTLLADFRRTVPELRHVDLLDAPDGPVIGTPESFVAVSRAGLFTYAAPGGARRRSLSVLELVRVLNRLLHLRGCDRQILPLAGVDGVEAYMPLRREQAAVLEEVGVFDGTLASLGGLVLFRPVSGVVRRAERFADERRPPHASPRWRAFLRVA